MQRFFRFIWGIVDKIELFALYFPLFGIIWAQLSRSTQKTESLHVVEQEYESVSDSTTSKSHTANNIATKVFDCPEYMFYGTPAFGYCLIPSFLPLCQLFLTSNTAMNNSWFYSFFSYFLTDFPTIIAGIRKQLGRLSNRFF